MSRRRQGMFAHARYSEKVFRNLTPKIAEGVQRDIAYILKKDKPIDVQRWNRALPSQSEIDQNNDDDYFQSHANDGAASSSSYQPSRPQQQRRPRRNANPKPLDLRSEFMSARELFNKEYHSTEESIIPSRVLRSSSSTHYQTTKDETPTAFKTPQNAPAHKRSKRIPATGDAAVAADTEKVFPANVDPNLIAERVRKGLPYLPMRRGDATSYKDAITDILKETIGAFLQPTGDGKVSIGSSVRQRQTTVEENIDPFDALMNKTGVINLSRSSYAQSERSDESPTMSINELSHLRQGLLNQSYVNEVNENPISGAFFGNIPSPQSDDNLLMGDYDRDIEEIIDSNNIPDSNEFDHLAIKTPSVYSQASVLSLGHQSTLRTPSISETFNNLSNQDLDFRSQNSFEFDDFKLSFNPSNFTQTLPASSGFLNSTLAPRHDSINATFLRPLQSTPVPFLQAPRQASRSNEPFLQPPSSRQSSSRSTRISGLHSRISAARKRKAEEVEEEETLDSDEAFFRF